MSRILKALFKTIIVFLGIVLFTFLKIMFPFQLLILIIIIAIAHLRVKFY